MTEPTSALSREVETYARLLPSLVSQQGKYVLIQGDEMAGTFDSYRDALTAGYQRFGLAHFLVKQISPTEQVFYVTRNVSPCPA